MFLGRTQNLGLCTKVPVPLYTRNARPVRPRREIMSSVGIIISIPLTGVITAQSMRLEPEEFGGLTAILH